MNGCGLIAVGIFCFTLLVLGSMWSANQQKKRDHIELMAAQERMHQREQRGILN